MKDWLNNSNIIENATNIMCTMLFGKEIQMIDMDSQDMDCPLPESSKTNLWKILGFFLD